MTTKSEFFSYSTKPTLGKIFPGCDCGNPDCRELCNLMFFTAITMRLDIKQAVKKAINDHICSKYHCIALNEENKNISKMCRFGFLPSEKDTIAFASELKQKIFIAGNNEYPTCKRLDGTIIPADLENMPSAMQEKGFYRQADGLYKPHPHCKCRWKEIKGLELRFINEELDERSKFITRGKSFDGLDDLMTQIKRYKLPDHRVSKLVVIAHGAGEGNLFPMHRNSSKKETMFDEITHASPKQKMNLEEIKRIMVPYGLIELRMCEGVKDESGRKKAQAIANATGCRVKAYSTDVNPIGYKSYKISNYAKKINPDESKSDTLSIMKPVKADFEIFYPQNSKR